MFASVGIILAELYTGKASNDTRTGHHKWTCMICCRTALIRLALTLRLFELKCFRTRQRLVSNAALTSAMHACDFVQTIFINFRQAGKSYLLVCPINKRQSIFICQTADKGGTTGNERQIRDEKEPFQRPCSEKRQVVWGFRMFSTFYLEHMQLFWLQCA